MIVTKLETYNQPTQLVMVRSHDPAESESQMVEDEGGSTEMLVGDLFAALAAAMIKVG